MSEKTRFPDVMLLAAGNELALAPIGDQPLIERVMSTARSEGATRFVANARADEHDVLAHFGGLIKVSRETEQLPNGRAVAQALPMLHSDQIFVMETQGFWPAGSDQPLARMLARASGEADIVLLCVHPRNAVGFGRSHDFCLSPQGLITRDYGAPVIFTGVALLDKALFRSMPETLDALFDAALENETLQGVVLDAPWYHVADATGLAAAQERLAA